MTSIRVNLKINGTEHSLDVEPWESLNFTLRERLGLTGTKKGCDTGGCGACTVIVNGKSRYSCMTFTSMLDGRAVETIEALASEGKLSTIQEAFVAHGGLQCGYCTPGFVLSTKALLERKPRPSDEEIKEALIGNICRCTGYAKILSSVRALAKENVQLSAEGRKER